MTSRGTAQVCAYLFAATIAVGCLGKTDESPPAAETETAPETEVDPQGAPEPEPYEDDCGGFAGAVNSARAEAMGFCGIGPYGRK